MTSRTRKVLLALISPLLTAGVLFGIVVENRKYLKAEDFEPYHQRAKTAIDAIPMVIPPWSGMDALDDIPREAQVLLKPNVILSRRYKSFSFQRYYRDLRFVHLLVVQCKQSGDMLGHFPPVCYPSHGHELLQEVPREWEVNNLRIPGTEYQFTINNRGQVTRTTVYNFFVVPGRGIIRDMDGVQKAAKNYQQRYYGAAQFQLVFQGTLNADLSRDERDEIFRTLMGPAVPVIDVLKSELHNGAIQ